MRVMQLTTDLRFGGAERVIVNLVRCLRDRGIECAVAGLFQGGESPAMMRETLEDAGFEVFCAEFNRKYMLWRLDRLRRFVKDWRPDVLHCHLFHGHAAGALLKIVGPRHAMVWTHHSVDPRPLRHRSVLYRLLSGTAACHVFASQAARGFHRNRCRAAPWEEVIYNGIDLGPYLAVTPQAGRTFGALGRLVPAKGFDVLVRAFARLRRDDDAVRLKIAGAGPAEAELRELIRAEGLADTVQQVGFVRDVPGFLSGVNVFVLPSRWEAFGLALLEAMAAGLPCVASRVGGMPEVGGELVRWVEPDDVEGLHAAMREQLSARRSSDDVARQRAAVSRFSQDAMAEGYLRIYRSLLARKQQQDLEAT
jgi:glycosyltransferase involved in cell wall biosynthesis